MAFPPLQITQTTGIDRSLQALLIDTPLDLAHHIDKFTVCAGPGKQIQSLRDRLFSTESIESAAHGVDRTEFVRCQKEIVSAGTGPDYIYGRENAALGETSVKHEFHIAGSLKLIKYNIVHFAARVNKGCREDGQRDRDRPRAYVRWTAL